MNFIGSGQAVSEAGLVRASHTLAVGVAKVRAILQVEAAGRPFNQDKTPVMRPEPHWFLRLLPHEKKARAVEKGFAYYDRRNRIVARRTIPRTQIGRYHMLRQWMMLDKDAALQACSWGAPQIMGFNFQKCGYGSVGSFVASMVENADNQLMAMAGFIKSSYGRERGQRGGGRIRLDEALRRGDYDAFAFGYNGPAYKRNRYARKIGEFVSKLKAKEMTRLEYEDQKTDIRKKLDTGGKQVVCSGLMGLLSNQLHELQNVSVYLPLAGKIAGGVAILILLGSLWTFFRSAKKAGAS